jgi:hypothetical protein
MTGNLRHRVLLHTNTGSPMVLVTPENREEILKILLDRIAQLKTWIYIDQFWVEEMSRINTILTFYYHSPDHTDALEIIKGVTHGCS